MARKQSARNPNAPRAMDAEDHSVQGLPPRLLRDTTEDRVVTGILQVGERYVASRRAWDVGKDHPSEVSRGGEQGLPVSALTGMIAIADMIESLLVREPDLAEIIYPESDHSLCRSRRSR
jgi:hypothetical protein